MAAIGIETKLEVWEAHNGASIYGECYCCGTDLSILAMDMGHVTADAAGGVTAAANLRPICHPCNIQMHVGHMHLWMVLTGKRAPEDISDATPDEVALLQECVAEFDNAGRSMGTLEQNMTRAMYDRIDRNITTASGKLSITPKALLKGCACIVNIADSITEIAAIRARCGNAKIKKGSLTPSPTLAKHLAILYTANTTTNMVSKAYTTNLKQIESMLANAKASSTTIKEFYAQTEKLANNAAALQRQLR